MKQKLTIIFICFFVFGGIARANDHLSLERITEAISKLQDKEKLVYLNDLVKENKVSTLRLPLAKMLRDEALEQDDKEYYANAVYELAKHFYTYDPDSMRYWINIAEPLFLDLGRKEDICRMKAWDIYMLSRENDQETAIKSVDELKRFSDEINFPEGIEMADQALANIYISSKHYDEGEKLYLDVLSRMEKRNSPLVKRYNILRQLFSTMVVPEKKLFYLAKTEEIVEISRARGLDNIGEENPLFMVEYVIARSYASAYISLKQFDKALQFLKKAQEIADTYHLARAETEMNLLWGTYYLRSGDYQSSLRHLDFIIANYRQRGLYRDLLPRMKEKALALDALGRSKESNALYREYILLKDSVNDIDFNEKLADVRTKYEVDRLELAKQQMEIEAKQNKTRMMFLFGGCGVLLFIILILVYLNRIIQRSRFAYKEAKEKAEEADQMKSAFLANMNHEIRTPLNAIVGFSQVLIEEEDKDVREEFASIIQSNNELLQRLIADVLDISKIESNSMSLVYSQQKLPVIMKEIYNMILLRMQPGVELILAPCTDVVIDTDRNRLVQIMTNLLTNAIKHTPSGHIKFGYEILDDNIRFFVEDTGEGIQEDKLESIFNRFVQLENGKKGVGLGLAISRGLVTKMNGKIWVTSTVNVGSTFYAQVPLHKPQEN